MTADGERQVCNVCRRAMTFRRIGEAEGLTDRGALADATGLALSAEYQITQARSTDRPGDRKKFITAAVEKVVALFEALEKAREEGVPTDDRT